MNTPEQNARHSAAYRRLQDGWDGVRPDVCPTCQRVLDVQNVRDANPPKPKQNVPDPGGTPVHCDDCSQLLAVSYGAHLDCFAFVIEQPVSLRCERCRNVTLWSPRT